MGDARVTRSSHSAELCIPNIINGVGVSCPGSARPCHVTSLVPSSTMNDQRSHHQRPTITPATRSEKTVGVKVRPLYFVSFFVLLIHNL
jgi:hypothetical protein